MKRFAITLVIAGCGPVGDASDEATSDSTISPSTSATTSSASTDPTTPPGEATSVADESTNTAEDASFFIRPDGGNPYDACDLWAQDCPPGEKCTPWANDSGDWNATRCSPIDPNPQDVGEPCTVVGSGVSGIDDCVLGAMCWDVDPETNMGECVALCMGSETNPICVDPCSRCSVDGAGVLILCTPMCDPIAQDCDEHEACYGFDDAFECVPDASGELGAIGDVCEYLNVCDPGSFCASPGSVPGCEGSIGCCAPFCNADAEDVCDALLPGTSCVPWYEEGREPDTCIGAGTIGACMVMP